MAITHVNGGFFDPEHAESLREFGFRGSVPVVPLARGGKARAMPAMDAGGMHPHAHPHGHSDIVRTENRTDGAWVEHHAHGGQTVHHVDGLVTHHMHNGAPAQGRHDDAKQDRALIMKMIKEHEGAEGDGKARGGRVKRAGGGSVNPGGRRISAAEFGAINEDYVNRGSPDGTAEKRRGGVRSEYPNLTSNDPATEQSLREREALQAQTSAIENEHESDIGRDLDERYTNPEDRARYHGFKKGGKVRVKRAEGGAMMRTESRRVVDKSPLNDMQSQSEFEDAVPRTPRARYGDDMLRSRTRYREFDDRPIDTLSDAPVMTGYAKGGMVRLPRGMKPKVAQSHSPILSPNNTAPRKPQVTRTPPNEMPGGVMPYGTMPSDESGYEQTSPTGATASMMKKGGRVRA